MSTPLRRRAQVSPPLSRPPSHPPSSTRRINLISKAALDHSTASPASFLAGARGAAAAILLHLSVATIFLAIAEGWPLLDALYFSVVIATTVGYGDIAPTRPASKLFVSAYAILSVALIGGLLQRLVERVADAQHDVVTRGRQSWLLATQGGADVAGDADLLGAARRAVQRARLKLRGTITMLTGLCVSGGLLYGYFLHASLVDLVYFLCVSMTTVGLGDIHPVTRVGKAYAAVWLVFASLGFASIVSQYADLRVKEREQQLVENVFSDDIGDRMFADIDGDNDGTLSEAEFLGFMLCKLGKASPDDVKGVLEKFRDLDKDNSGFITKQEVTSVGKKRA